MTKHTYLSSIKNISLIVVACMLLSCGTLIQPRVKTGIVQLESGSYQLDQAHAAVLFKVNHMGLSTFVGRFNKVDASLEFDPSNISAAKLSAAIEIASMDVNNSELEETLRSSSWFYAEKYPQALFTTVSVTQIDKNTAVFTGNLTLHGITAPVDLTVTFHGGGKNWLTGFYTLGFSATGSFNRAVFGIDNLIPAIADKVDVEVFAEFQQK